MHSANKSIKKREKAIYLSRCQGSLPKNRTTETLIKKSKKQQDYRLNRVTTFQFPSNRRNDRKTKKFRILSPAKFKASQEVITLRVHS